MGNHRGSSLIINFCETLAQEPDSTGRGLIQPKKKKGTGPQKDRNSKVPEPNQSGSPILNTRDNFGWFKLYFSTPFAPF